eukprot:1265040-Alexandrium_andersonii.AAC.1
MHAVLHGLRLECPSWEAVAKIVNSIVSWTTDLGTEASFSSLPGANLRDLFPWIQAAVPAFDCQRAGENFGDPAGEAAF